MLQHLPALQKLVNQLRHVPYLASKNVYRVAMHFLTHDEKKVQAFCDALMEAREAVKNCMQCHNWTEVNDLCVICAQGSRRSEIICVVETWHDLVAVERAGGFRGVYHVLGGALSPLEGIGPDDLTIASLLERVAGGEISELIFATNPTPEGEATARFIASKIEKSEYALKKLFKTIFNE